MRFESSKPSAIETPSEKTFESLQTLEDMLGKYEPNTTNYRVCEMAIQKAKEMLVEEEGVKQNYLERNPNNQFSTDLYCSVVNLPSGNVAIRIVTNSQGTTGGSAHAEGLIIVSNDEDLSSAEFEEFDSETDELTNSEGMPGKYEIVKI